MPDPIDQNNNTTPQSTLPDPQAVVDAALDPAIANAAPSPESLPPMPSVAEPKIEEVAPPTMTSLPTPPTDSSVATAPVEPAPATPAPSNANVAMGDETPLAFMTPPPSTTPETKTEPMPNLGTSAPLDAVPPAPTPAPEQVVKKGGKMKKTIGVVLGVFLFAATFVFGGYYAYLSFGGAQIPSISYITKFIKVGDQVVRNPDWDKLQESGGSMVDPNTGKTVTADQNNDLRDKDLGIGDYAPPKGDNAQECQSNGGFWCTGSDSKGSDYAFCGSNTSGKACYQQAIEKGYTFQIGILKCVDPDKDGTFTPDETIYGTSAENRTFGEDTYSDIATKCGQTYSTQAQESFICKVGVSGVGTETQQGQVYDGSGECTAVNGKPYSGNPKGCFCGTVQVDTPNGHTSYSSTCGCDKEEKTTTTVVESPSPSPVMACTGLAQAPTAPKVGDKVTFTCSGTITPSTAGTLSYKFRYSIGTGAVTTLANKTATTAELTIAACGDYKVECQTCATISGVLQCDPNWTGATTP